MTVSSRRLLRLYSVSFALIIALQRHNAGISAHILPHLNIGLGSDTRPPVAQENYEQVNHTPLISNPLGSLSLITSEKKNSNDAAGHDSNIQPNAGDRKVIGINLHLGPHRLPYHPYTTGPPLFTPECDTHMSTAPVGPKQPKPNPNVSPLLPPFFGHKPLTSTTTVSSIPVSSSTTYVPTSSESNSNVASTSTTIADLDVLIGNVFANSNNADSERNNGNSNTNERQTDPEITGEGILDIRMPKLNSY